MQFKKSNLWRWAGVGSAMALAVAGCTAPGRAPQAVEVAEPPVEQMPVVPTVGVQATEPPSVQAPAPSAATPQAVTQPVPRRRPMPRYPSSLAETGLAGTVVASFT